MDYLLDEAKRLDADLWAATDESTQITIFERIQRNNAEIRSHS
jgi:hypothetical protein